MSAFGSVKWFNDAKGFGFIEPEDGGKDVFAHHTSIQMEGFRTLKAGGRVQFDLVAGKDGPAAQNILPLYPLPKKKDKAAVAEATQDASAH